MREVACDQALNGVRHLSGGKGATNYFADSGMDPLSPPERELAIGYVMNQMAGNLAGDLRAQRIINSAAAVVDAMS